MSFLSSATLLFKQIVGEQDIGSKEKGTLGTDGGRESLGNAQDGDRHSKRKSRHMRTSGLVT